MRNATEISILRRSGFFLSLTTSGAIGDKNE